MYPYNLPMVMSHKRTSSTDRDEYSFTCELFDPYTQKVRKISNSIKKFRNLYCDHITVYASKDSWLLLGSERSSLFLHNPFTNDVILLPDLYLHCNCVAATFKSNPTSPECVIFMLCKADDFYLHISTYSLSKDREWNIEFLEMTGDVQVFSVKYLNGELYCLFEDGVLKSYSLEDESWKLLTSGFPEPYASCFWQDKCWLTKNTEDIIVVRKDYESDIHKWMIFRFDWSKMCWVVETSLKGCAFFISGNVVLSAPLIDCNGNHLKDCRIFLYDEYDGDDNGYGFKCYSLCEGEWTQLQSAEYSWIKRPALWEMCFIEPPYIQPLIEMTNSRPWSDLPQGILGLFLNKLNFADQIRFLAVCKSWQGCKDGVKCSDCLPWVMSHERVSKRTGQQVRKRAIGTYSFICELFDPYSQKVHKISNSAENFNDLYSSHTVVYASKKGWLLFGGNCSSLYLHNPFTNEIIALPDLYAHCDYMGATFKMNPTSSEFEIFVVYNVDDMYLHISTYRLFKDRDWNTQFIEMYGDLQLFSVLHMKGNLYCVFDDGQLNCYSLGDGSWKMLTSTFPEPYASCRWLEKCWLIENKEDLIMVRLDREGHEPEPVIYKWTVFRFDWSDMCWAVERSLKNCAIFISGNVAWSAPLTDGNGANLEDCMLFYYDEFDGDSDGWGFKCYSLNEKAGAVIQSKEYGWIRRKFPCELGFIEPPYFGI